MKLRICGVCAFLVATVSSTGCLISGSSRRVARNTEPLESVRFESDEARKAFQQYALDDNARLKSASSYSVAVPFLLGVSNSTVRSENAYYNDWVARVDANQDGMISNLEVAGLRKTHVVDTNDGGDSGEDGRIRRANLSQPTVQ